MNSPSPTAAGLRGSADQLASAYPALLIQSERIANAIVHGAHGRRRTGPGSDFWQYRPYSPGDSISRIDWRKTARAGKTLIRESEWAATNTVFVWASQTAGMDFMSDMANTTKRERAAVLAMTIATLAIRAGERVGVLGWQQAPGHTRLVLRRMAAWYSGEADEKFMSQSLPPQVPLPRHASCVLIGDFLDPLDKLRARLGDIADAGLHGHIVQVTDPAEETLPYHGRTEFIEMNTGEKLVAGRAETLKQDYIAALARHRDGLRQLARQLGWTFAVHHTDQSPHPLLVALYSRLSQRAGASALIRSG
ncbi:MAG: DUF58 domain-containing protein [Anderseniella sp.]